MAEVIIRALGSSTLDLLILQYDVILPYSMFFRHAILVKIVKKVKITLLNEKEFLCIEVENYPCIYDKSHVNYKNNNAKMKVWTEIRRNVIVLF